MQYQILKMQNNENMLRKACLFLEMDMPIFSSSSVEERIKELCVIKVCNCLGIKYVYNYNNRFLEFFSSVMGEALVDKLNLNISIAGPEIRFVKYNHVSLINEVQKYLNNADKNEAFIDAFNFLEDFKFLAIKLQAIN